MKREEKTERILNSLDGMHRAEANPFLYTRVMQAIENKKNISASKWVPRLAFALVVFVLLNAFTFLQLEKTNASKESSKSDVESFANEYGLTDSNNS